MVAGDIGGAARASRDAVAFGDYFTNDEARQAQALWLADRVLSPAGVATRPPAVRARRVTRSKAADAPPPGLFDDLLAAIAKRDMEAVGRLGNLARTNGWDRSDVPWDQIDELEAIARDRQALTEALAYGRAEAAGRAWARLRAMYPGALSDAEDRDGRAAFCEWGRGLRVKDRTRTESQA